MPEPVTATVTESDWPELKLPEAGVTFTVGVGGAVTVTVAVPEAGAYVGSPLYCAFTVAVPTVRLFAGTLIVAEPDAKVAEADV